MIRCGRLAVAVLLCVAVSSPVAGQTPVGLFVAGGANIPMGDFGDLADAGWMIGGGVLAAVGAQGLWLGAEGMYASNSYKDTDDADFQLVGGGGMVGLTFNRGARISPYVFGSAGVLSVKVDAGESSSESESEFAWGGGAGLAMTMSPRATLFASGRYIKAGDLSMVPVSVGVLLWLSGPPQ
jgi:opacity protein-like surface antigen